jgi:hypothetical protein
VLGKLDFHMWKTETRTLSLTLCKNLIQKWIEDLKARPETLKLLEGKHFKVFLKNIFKG